MRALSDFLDRRPDVQPQFCFGDFGYRGEQEIRRETCDVQTLSHQKMTYMVKREIEHRHFLMPLGHHWSAAVEFRMFKESLGGWSVMADEPITPSQFAAIVVLVQDGRKLEHGMEFYVEEIEAILSASVDLNIPLEISRRDHLLVAAKLRKK
jgi:hypothetical protein